MINSKYWENTCEKYFHNKLGRKHKPYEPYNTFFALLKYNN